MLHVKIEVKVIEELPKHADEELGLNSFLVTMPDFTGDPEDVGGPEMPLVQFLGENQETIARFASQCGQAAVWAAVKKLHARRQRREQAEAKAAYEARAAAHKAAQAGGQEN